MTENADYFKMLARMIRAGARRVADADETDLGEFAQLQREFNESMKKAVQGLIAKGHSWAYVARGLGMTRQAAFKRFAK